MYKDFLVKDKEGKLTNNFIETEAILSLIEEKGPTGDSPFFQIAKSVLEIKAVRAQTSAIKKSSESSDTLTKVGLGLSFLLVIHGFIEVYSLLA